MSKLFAHPLIPVFRALIPAFFYPSLHHPYRSIPSIKMSDVCFCGRLNCLVVICNVNMWLRVRAPLPLDAPVTHTHTHTEYSENNQQLPGSALILLPSHNCSRASPLSALVHPSQAANHQQPLQLASPRGSDRPTMEPIVSTQDTARTTLQDAYSIFT